MPPTSIHPPVEGLSREPLGAEVLDGGGVHFRVWAPKRRQVDVILEAGPGAPREVHLQPAGDGYHAGIVPEAAAGTLYRYRLDQGQAFPDPASRFQPDGPHGPSQVIDPRSWRWTDDGWRGLQPHGQILYELHIGTFTPEGTFSTAMEELEQLASLGITALEVMPVAEFGGSFGWGYDGVDLFAPHHRYGSPDDFRAFVDRAHGLGMGVILDVVYNHLGPVGNYLAQFSDSYFSDRYETEWGEPLNFDGPDSWPVRDFFIANAARWIREYHLDGLRLDATQSIFDSHRGAAHIIAEISHAARQAAAPRSILLVAENEPQDPDMVRPSEAGGFGLNMLWNDDFHHSALVALTGRNEAYYQDYLGTPQELVSAARWGYLYQGQHYSWQSKRRGRPAFDLPPHAFVSYLQNHDQIANSGRGHRIDRLTSPARLRAMTGLLLLGPGTPMLFMGQEFGASTPFLYFADHEGELAEAVREGRREFLAQFPSLAHAELPDPGDPATFRRCVLDPQEREQNAATLLMYRELIQLRRSDRVLSKERARGPEGAVLGRDAFVLRYFDESGDDRLLVVNLGREIRFSPAPEPLLAPVHGRGWSLLWSSEDPRYGGNGAPDPEDGEGRWHLAAECTMLLGPATPSLIPAALG